MFAFRGRIITIHKQEGNERKNENCEMSSFADHVVRRHISIRGARDATFIRDLELVLNRDRVHFPDLEF